MKIKFIHADDDYYGVEKYIRPLAEATVKYEIFIEILCTILNTFNKFEEPIFKKIEQTLKDYQLIYIEDKDELTKADYAAFSKLVKDFYWNVLDDVEFAKEIQYHTPELYEKHNLRFVDNRLGIYRGILFEEIVCATVKDRFDNCQFDTGCQIHINGLMVRIGYRYGNVSHKQTIDIAGWSQTAQYGEFYECKINPKRFDESNYRYFMELQNKLNDNNMSSYILALVSADSKNNIAAQIEFIEANNSDCDSEFRILGREDIYEINNYVIPEIA